MPRTLALVFLLAITATAAVASAAQFALNPVITGAYNTAFEPLPSIDIDTINGQQRIFEVDLRVTTSNLQPGERGFGNVGFNIGLTGVTEAGAGGYNPNSPTTDSNGAAPGGTVPLFATNADAGPSPSDLQGIFATIAGGLTNPNASDMRVKIGQPGGPSSLGQIFVLWNATSTFRIEVKDTQWSVYLDTGVFASSQGFGGTITNILTPDPFPEPASLVMAGLSLVGLVAATRRRRS